MPIRGFGKKGGIGPMKMDLHGVVSPYSRGLTVEVPKQDVYDATAAIVGALDGFDGP